MTRLIPILFLLFIISSCDPGYVVILSNQSLKDKSIKVIVTNKDKIRYLDSIAIVDSLINPARILVAVSKDSIESSYSFALGKGENAILQQGIGGPDLSEKIIVDLSDTISLSEDKNTIRMKEGTSTVITVRLQ